ncbi:PfkB family carbohydrate kinase, partial [Pyxidicoccus sp. 3LG]
GCRWARRAPSSSGRRAPLLAVPPRVEVASTVGAGDAMVSGVLASRLAGGSLEDCARHATAFAAGKLAQVGPVPAPPERVGALRREVVIHSLGRA